MRPVRTPQENLAAFKASAIVVGNAIKESMSIAPLEISASLDSMVMTMHGPVAEDTPVCRHCKTRCPCDEFIAAAERRADTRRAIKAKREHPRS